MSKVEACVLHKVDGVEVLEIVGSRRGGWLRQRFEQCRLYVVLSRL